MNATDLADILGLSLDEVLDLAQHGHFVRVMWGFRFQASVRAYLTALRRSAGIRDEEADDD